MLSKLHGLGNDYLVADPADLPFAITPPRVRLLCDRHLGVGSDGLLVLDLELGVRIFNPDGSEAEKSGNGLRIFARWLRESGRVQTNQFSIRTRGGVANVEVSGREVTVDMGPPTFREDLRRLDVDGERYDVVALSIGNPHCVVFREGLDITELRRIGPLIERHSAFPDRTNVQLAHVIGRHAVELLIWERGAGETLSSGSSSCAVVAAAHHRGLVNTKVAARMPGGQLSIRVDATEHVWMTGPVEEIARVTLAGDLIARLQALPSPA